MLIFIYMYSPGYIHGIDAYICGCLTRNLGAGRQVPEDLIDHAVGMKLTKDIGDYIQAGEKTTEMSSRY